MTDFVKTASEATLDQAIANGVTLVDFWADWCAPCKAIAPVLAELAEHYADEVSVVKVDVVANEAAAQRFGARSIPLLVLFKDGQEVARLTGAVSKTRLATFIDAHL